MGQNVSLAKFIDPTVITLGLGNSPLVGKHQELNCSLINFANTPNMPPISNTAGRNNLLGYTMNSKPTMWPQQ